MTKVKNISPEKITFEFIKEYSDKNKKSDYMTFGGEIQSIDWKTEKAIVNVHDDEWLKVMGTSPEKVEITLLNLIRTTEKVSSKSYAQLEEMLKEVYPSLKKKKKGQASQP